MAHLTVRSYGVSQIGSTCGETIWQNGQKLNENHKINILGANQWGTWGKNNFGGNAEVPQSPFKGNPVLCHIRVLE